MHTISARGIVTKRRIIKDSAKTQAGQVSLARVNAQSFLFANLARFLSLDYPYWDIALCHRGSLNRSL